MRSLVRVAVVDAGFSRLRRPLRIGAAARNSRISARRPTRTAIISYVDAQHFEVMHGSVNRWGRRQMSAPQSTRRRHDA